MCYGINRHYNTLHQSQRTTFRLISLGIIISLFDQHFHKVLQANEKITFVS